MRGPSPEGREVGSRSFAGLLRKVALARAAPLRKNVGELRAKEEYLGGIVDPGQHHQKGTRGSIRGGKGAVPEIEAEEDFSHYKEDGSEYSANPDIAPGDALIRKVAIDSGKEEGDEHEQDRQM